MKTTRTFSDQELHDLVNEVAQDLKGALAGEANRLNKAAPDDLPDDGPGSAPPGPGPSVPPSAPPSAPPAGDAAEGSQSASPEAPPGSPPAEDSVPPEGDPAGEQAGGPVDFEALKAEYAKLPPEELKMQYMACKEALYEVLGAGGGDPAAGASPAPGPGAPGASAPAAPPPGGPGGPQMALKNELKANGGQIKVGKSEADAKFADVKKSLDEKDAKLVELTKNFESLVGVVDKVLGQPIRRAVTGVNFVAKTEDGSTSAPKSKDDITKILTEKSRDPSLKKNDRDAINRYFNTHCVDVKGIEHLLK